MYIIRSDQMSGLLVITMMIDDDYLIGQIIDRGREQKEQKQV